MGYTNSPLTAYTKLSPNHSGQRTHAIDRITPHCVVGQCTAESLGDWFAKSSTQASSNYGIDKDGRVGLYVEEKNRSYSILNRLPYPHYILHHKAYNCYSAPATATKQYRLSTLLFRPIAAMAIMIKNLLSSLRGLKISEGTPIPKQSVVIIEARTKNTMNIGNALLKLKPLVVLPSFFASFALR